MPTFVPVRFLDVGLKRSTAYFRDADGRPTNYKISHKSV